MDLPDEQLARRVGAVALGALALTIAGFVFLLDRVHWGTPIEIRVAFHHVAGLREHAPFVVAGRAIGRVEALTPIPHGAFPGEPDGVGVAATVSIDAHRAWQVPASAEIFVASRGPLSDKYLEVAPPKAAPGPGVQGGQTLRGVDPPTLDNVLQHTWNNMNTYRDFVAAVRPELGALRAQLTALQTNLDTLIIDAALDGYPSLVAQARALIAAGRETYAGLGGEPGAAALRETIQQSRAVIAQLRAAIDLLAPEVDHLVAEAARLHDGVSNAAPIERAQQILARAREALDKIDPVLANLDALTAQIAAGEGSIGRIMTDPEFPEDTRDLGKIMKRHPWKIMETPPDK